MSRIDSIITAYQKSVTACKTFPNCRQCGGRHGDCSVIKKLESAIDDLYLAPVQVIAKPSATKAPDPRKAAEKPSKPGKIQSPALMAKNARKTAGKKTSNGR